MKVLYVITGLRLGGAEKQLLLLAQSMKSSGIEVFVVAMESGGELASSFTANGIQVEELDISDFKSLIKGYRKFARLVQVFSPDIIHSHMIHANLFARTLRFFNKHVKVISTAHNIYEGNRALMRVYQLTSSLANWSTNVSQEAYDYFIKQKYFNPEKSSYLPNAIDTLTFSPFEMDIQALIKRLNIPKQDYVFFCAGRLHEQKNHEMLLNAFNIVQQKISKVSLIIAGEGPLYQFLKETACDLGLNGKVYLIGSSNNMPALMQLCNCFVLSSNYEGFGLVVGEAMAMQKPVIATDCGGVKEVMNGYGVLVKAKDTIGLAEAMINIYQSPFSSDCLAKARQHIENNYAVDVVRDQWTQLYERIA